MSHLQLRKPPLDVFYGSRTPVGLYVRRKWLGESDSEPWKTDFGNTVAALMANQDSDGSWGGSVENTVHHLFGLHLTIREPDDVVEKGIDWLREQMSAEPGSALPTCPGRGTVEGLPFVVSEKKMFLVGTTLFLATIFGQGNYPDIQEQYRVCCRQIQRQTRQWVDTASLHNIFRALVVHPDFVAHKATIEHVKYLAGEQNSSGNWGEPLSFYQTFNAMAHMDLTLADEQIEKALPMIVHSQNGDGSWGGKETEWNTFLAVHALKNKGFL